MSQINFLPVAHTGKRLRRHRMVRETLWVLAVGMSLALWHWCGWDSRPALQVQWDNLRHQLEVQGQPEVELVRVEHEQLQLQQRINLTRELTAPVRVADVLACISQSMPSPLALTSLALHEQMQPTPQQAKAVPALKLQVSLVGLAPQDTDVADLVARLAQHPLFTNVKMVYTRAATTEKLQARQFRVEMEVPLDRDYVLTPAAVEVAHAH